MPEFTTEILLEHRNMKLYRVDKRFTLSLLDAQTKKPVATFEFFAANVSDAREIAGHFQLIWENYQKAVHAANPQSQPILFPRSSPEHKELGWRFDTAFVKNLQSKIEEEGWEQTLNFLEILLKEIEDFINLPPTVLKDPPTIEQRIKEHLADPKNNNQFFGRLQNGQVYDIRLKRLHVTEENDEALVSRLNNGTTMFWELDGINWNQRSAYSIVDILSEEEVAALPEYGPPIHVRSSNEPPIPPVRDMRGNPLRLGQSVVAAVLMPTVTLIEGHILSFHAGTVRIKITRTSRPTEIPGATGSETLLRYHPSANILGL